MGVSTDAILAFGFDLGEEWPEALRLGDEEDTDFDEWIADHLGLGDWQAEGYWQRLREAVAAFPVDIITHCSYDYPEYFIAVRGTESRAKRGYPVTVKMEDVEAAKIEVMREFCEKYGIEWQEPSWHIFSLWG